MNCAECRENLIAVVEGLLDPAQSRECQAHLNTCAPCRAEHAAITRLQRQLVARGRATAEVSIIEPVMRRVQQVHAEQERNTIMSRLFTRWGFGLSAAAGAAAIILIIALASTRVQATAAQVMAKGAQAVAKLSSIHLRGQVRTTPAENFGHIDPAMDFVSIELWKQFEPDLKWRVEKSGRVAVMDGQSTVLYIKPANMGMKVPQPSKSAFDTDWLHKIANLSNTITNELKNAIAKGWKLNLTEERGADGRTKAVVTIEAKAGLPDNDYLKNAFFDTSDTRRVYRFDSQSELLEAVQVYLATASGEVQIFELTQIDYNQPIDPTVFRLELPANVGWYQEPQKLPDNEKYASMTAQQAAKALFEACGREDWTEAAKFFSMPIPEVLKQFLGGSQLVSVGKPFTSKGNDAQFVPYEIRLKNSVLTNKIVPYEIRLKNGVVTNNLSLKKDPRTGRWIFDGGI